MKEACTEPCKENADKERGTSCYRRAGSMEDGRKGHDGKRHIGDIVEEGFQERVLDLFPYERQRENSDSERDGGHDQEVNIDVMLHDFPPLPQGRAMQHRQTGERSKESCACRWKAP